MIFAPKMSEIVVEFDSFDMEPDTTPPAGAICRYDWLEIWDGFPAGEGALARISGTSDVKTNEMFEMFLYESSEGFK